MKKLLQILILTNLFYCSHYSEAALSGATSCNAGELAVIRSDVEATWTIYPANYSASYAVSNDGLTLYFASPKQGEVTIIAASVKEGKAVIDSHTLYNGVPAPVPMPEPTPVPEPTPEPAPETIESIVKIQANGKDPAELTALADSFAAVVDGIDRGTITTPAGARETFRAIWADKGTAANVNALNNLSGLISAISLKIDNMTLEGLRGDYARVVTSIRHNLPNSNSTPAPANCPDGNCPANVQRGWRR